MMDSGINNNENKLRIDIVTAHPDSLSSILGSSIIKIAIDKGIVRIELHNLHDFALDKYKHIDDTPFGGGAGMIIKCQPVFDCIEKLKRERTYDEIIYMTPDGEVFDQGIANELSLKRNIILLAGHYKGIDQRIRDHIITREISIGDYVLSGGEIPLLAVTDAIVRLIPGVLGDAESALEDSFMNGLLDCPQYTKPADYKGWKVPDVLLGGNHRIINQWRDDKAFDKTKRRRPDLLD